MIQDKKTQPRSWLRPPLFVLGQDLRGNWVVQEQRGVRGGLFVDRAAAERFIRAEAGYKPQASVIVSAILELDTGCNGSASAQDDVIPGSSPLRRIA